MNAMQYHIITQQIKRNGQTAIVSRPGTNAYGEPAGETIRFSISGLFHEAAASRDAYIMHDTDARKPSDEKKPFRFFCPAADIYSEDTITINGRAFKVVSIDDLGNEHEFYDISLEEVKDNV